MPTNLTDPETIIRQAKPGTMMFARVIFEPTAGWETALFVRETPAWVNRLGKNPVVELRAGVLVESEIALVALLMQAGGDLYESWFNYQATQESFADLAKQKRIVIAFYTPDKARQIVIANNLREFFKQARTKAKEFRRWTMNDFNSAREKVYSRYPEVADLWKAIGG